uniref:7TM GPCR serpentine receptor class x (Srx) domain-containing protein n=1 Tax=Meloidogyne incognita TaxID=6306 RepID=A0A914LR51_MELIC
MYSLWKQQKDGNPCYRILLYCGIMDFGILWSLGILAPILALNGSVYCTNPLITFITGATNDFFYSCEMSASTLLALNRCMDILCSELTQILFEGNRVWIWLGATTIYGFYWLFFVNPSLFNSIYFAYFFNPYQGYIAADEYHPLTHTLHDWIIGGSVPVIYVLFLIGIRWKMRGAVGGLGITKLQMMSFIQVLILSFIHLVGCSLYVLMQMIPVTESLIILAEFVWFINHGKSSIYFFPFSFFNPQSSLPKLKNIGLLVTG